MPRSCAPGAWGAGMLAAVLGCLGIQSLEARAAADTTAPTPPALRLPATAKPLRQSVELTIRPSEETFSGRTEIDVNLTEATSFLWLHGHDLKVKEARAHSGSARVVAQATPAGEDYLGLAFERPVGPGKVRLEMTYEGVIQRKDTQGLFAQKEGEDWYVFTQLEPTAARRVFPSFDEPHAKIPWTVKLTVPKETVALANAPETGVGDAADGMKTVTFAETPPMPSYLVAIAVGPFDLVDAGKVGRKGTPVRIAAPRGRGAEARWAAETTPTIVKLLEDYFDMPYPYAKLDQVAIPLTAGFGAMENAGLVTYAQGIILRKPEEENISFRRNFAGTCAHELAHMWFGDLVTMAWWDDLWLNESFASWMSSKIVDRWKPEWDVRVQKVVSRGGAMNQDSLATARRIRQPITSSHDIVNAFDGITYSKGEAILEMFEGWLGEEPFRRGVTAYLTKHSWSNATAADFLGALSGAAGRDVSPVVSTFLDQSGVPLVSAELLCGSGKPRLKLSQRPYRPVGSKQTQAKTWQIPLCARYGSGPQERVCTVLTGPEAEVTLGAATCPAWVQPNANAAGYFRVAYRGDLLSRLLKDGGKGLSLPERVSLLGDMAALVRSGDVPAAEALGVIPTMLQDPSRHIVSATASLVNAATGSIVPEELKPRLAAFVRDTYGARARALGWKAQAGDDEDTRLLRRSLVALVAIQGEDPVLGGEAVDLAQRWLEDPRAVDPDMLDVVLTAAARNGDRALFDRFRDEAAKAKDRLKRQRLLGALASFKDPAIVKEALALVLSDTFDSREAMGLLFGARQSEKTHALAYAFAKENFDGLLKRTPTEVAGFFPFIAAGFCDPDKRADVESFLRPRVEALPGGPRNLDQVLEGIDLCEAFRSAQQASVVSFLQKR